MEKKIPRRVLTVLAPLAVVALVAVAFFAGRSTGSSANRGPNGEYIRPAVGADGRIGYASEGVVATDPETLQDQVDKMMEQAKEPGVALEYKNVAFSENGQDFVCYLANSENNTYDMFITIYADQALTDELFLSELLRPGTRFENITLSRKLEPGEHTAYVVYTQVQDEEDKDKEVMIQTIHAQVATTITLAVKE